VYHLSDDTKRPEILRLRRFSRLGGVIFMGVMAASVSIHAAQEDQTDAPPAESKPTVESAETAAQTPEQIQAHEALERCINAMGSKEAWKAVESLSYVMTIAVDKYEVENEVHVRPTGEFAMRQIGEKARGVAMGWTGKIAWVAAAGLPPREAPKKNIAIVHGMVLSPLLPRVWKLTNQPMEAVGEVTFLQQPCLKVRLTEREETKPEDGDEPKPASKEKEPERFALFSVKTGLLVALDVPMERKKDTRAFVRFFDMKSCGDLLLPSRVESDRTGVRQTRRMSNVRFNIAKADVFEAPKDLIRNR
jgi:hypothetical protein